MRQSVSKECFDGFYTNYFYRPHFFVFYNKKKEYLISNNLVSLLSKK